MPRSHPANNHRDARRRSAAAGFSQKRRCTIYRCKICNAVGEPGQAQLRHPVKRRDGSISCELPVCPSCKLRLRTTPLADLLAEHSPEPRPGRPIPAVPSAPVPRSIDTLRDRINRTNRTT